MQGKNAGRAGRLIGLSALLAALLAAALLLWKPGGGEGPSSPPGGLGAVVPPAEEETPQPAEPAAEAGPSRPLFFSRRRCPSISGTFWRMAGRRITAA